MAYTNNIALDAKYDGVITLLDAINDPKISEKLDRFYVPEIQIMPHPNGTSIFIKRDASIALGDVGPRTIRFIYISPRGEIITGTDDSFTQVGQECKGFLARMSISRTNFVPSALSLDYLVNIASIRYRIDTVLSAVKNPETGVTEMISQEIMRFENMDFALHAHLNMDPLIKEFTLHKEELFEKYFA